MLTTTYMDELLATLASWSPSPPAANLRAAYLLDAGAGTTIADSGPHGLNGHIPIGNSTGGDSPVNYPGGYANSPTWTADGMSFDGTDGLAFPAGLFPAGDTTVYALLTPTVGTGPYPLCVLGWSGTVSNGAYFGLSGLSGQPACFEDIVTPFYGSPQPWYSGTAVVAFTYHAGGSSTTGGKVYLNGRDISGWLGQDPTPTDAAFAQAGPQNYAWGGCWYGAFNGYKGRAHALLKYDGQDSPATVLNTSAWLAALAMVRGLTVAPVTVPPLATRLIVIIGDSLAADYAPNGPFGSPKGGAALPTRFQQTWSAGVSGSYTWANFGVGGLTTTQVRAVAAAVLPGLLSARAAKTLVAVQTGHNESFGDTATLDALVGDLFSYGASDVIVETGLPSNNITGPAETARQTWNTHIRSALAGTHVAVADSGGDATIGPAWSSALAPYYPDGTHASAACDVIRGGYFLGAAQSKGYT